MCLKKGIPLIQLKERFLKINKQEFHRTQYILLYECVTLILLSHICLHYELVYCHLVVVGICLDLAYIVTRLLIAMMITI